jgi:nicotinamide-nucleotide amidase
VSEPNDLGDLGDLEDDLAEEPDDHLDDDGVRGQQLLGASLHAELLERGFTLATAESLTGGALGDLVSAAPGASETYLGGVVSYATEVKKRVLGVREGTVEKHGVVSEQCAVEMAEGVRSLMGTTWGVSTTGVAGPAEQEGKPVGLVFVAVSGPAGSRCKELRLDGDRAEIRRQTCTAAATLVLETVVDTGP